MPRAPSMGRKLGQSGPYRSRIALLASARQLQMVWPDDCPGGNCPPADAVARAEHVYRFVETDPPTAKDFRTHAAGFSRKAKRDPDKHCQACGVSVTDTLANARALSLLPLFAKRMVAEGHPTPGVVKVTPSLGKPGHMTWWIPKGATPWKNFRVLARAGA